MFGECLPTETWHLARDLVDSQLSEQKDVVASDVDVVVEATRRSDDSSTVQRSIGFR